MAFTYTGQGVEDVVYSFLKYSDFTGSINGQVYKYGMRPKDSTKEDAVVKFVTGSDTQDFQTGVVVVNVYVPDIVPYKDGIPRKNIKRCGEIETELNKWAESLKVTPINYRITKSQTVYTEEEAEIKQHFVTVRLKYKLFINN
jgi:hypothetical protein